jgi:hypothetical protein
VSWHVAPPKHLHLFDVLLGSVEWALLFWSSVYSCLQETFKLLIISHRLLSQLHLASPFLLLL